MHDRIITLDTCHLLKPSAPSTYNPSGGGSYGIGILNGTVELYLNQSG